MTKLALLAAAVQAVLGALVLGGVINLTDDQLAGIMLAVNAVLAFIASWFEPAIPWGKTG